MYEKQKIHGGKGSIKGSLPATSFKSSVLTKQSKLSAASLAKIKQEKEDLKQAALDYGVTDDIDEEVLNKLTAEPEDFIWCIKCKDPLTQEEKVINANLVNEAMASGKDISLYPVCLKGNHE